MTADLRLLDEVAWRGTPLPGGRTHSLLAALVVAGEGTLGAERALRRIFLVDRQPSPDSARGCRAAMGEPATGGLPSLTHHARPFSIRNLAEYYGRR